MSKKMKNNAVSIQEQVANTLHGDEIDALYEQLDPQDAGVVIVLEKFRVTPMLYSLVAHQLDSIAINLIGGIKYTAAELIGDSVWKTFGSEGQREMELCVKHFVAHPDSKLKDTHEGTFMLAK